MLSVFAATFWRRLAIAAGFPLSLLISGSVVLPAWAWLLPLLLVAIVYPVNAWRDAPLFPTPSAALNGLSAHAPLADGARILDAGCGLGDGLIALRAAYPRAALFGVEWSWPLRGLTALRCPWASIRQGDMWKAIGRSTTWCTCFNDPRPCRVLSRRQGQNYAPVVGWSVWNF